MSKRVVTATWDDVPHLSDQAKQDLLAGIPPYQRDARTKGVPQLGAGAIFPVPESDIIVPDFPVPHYWPRGYGLDVGWERTAVIWGAHDRDNDVAYLTGEHYRGQAEPVVHAQRIKAVGDWMPGFIDPAANGRSQIDGQRLFVIYTQLGLKVQKADNAREAGIHEVWMRLSTGRLKVFKSCINWLTEFRIFGRDENGRIIDEHKFHLMAATRYLFLTGIQHWKVKPMPKPAAARPRTGVWS